MELDEFKKSWGAVRREGSEQGGHTREALDGILERNASSLGELSEKSAFWNRIGGWNAALLVLLTAGYLVWQYHRGLGARALAGKLPLVAVLVGFALFSGWTYRRQEAIFSENTGASSREALSGILAAFKNYYRFTNSVFLVVSPVAFYAVFEIPGAGLSVATTSLASAALTGFSFLLRYWYYRAVFFPRIKAMESNLRELEAPPGFDSPLGDSG
ncbi:hypothetical protein I2I05_19835 [Hymenobacter sp. BT683]|uniref:Uncharacterized protein n=1 Tax=Hymenobacter jeongseonensis TaxID=2791027 RepID=A0ABS0IMQ3_9BACT|nr:hypothetical protein [Hymenobacter jeongseonensis]MBF9239654.1 hypothetical protein [Hymenobacter jeongseonensis]